MGLTIRALCLGKLHGTEKSWLTYLKDQGIKLIVPHIMWVIEGGEETVIVDSGAPRPEIVLEERGRLLERAGEQEPSRALKLAEINAAMVKIVVASHLHWDHSANFDIFPNAEIYVQRKELEFAVAGLPVFAEMYDSPLAKKVPRWLNCISMFKIVEGDIELIPGVRLIHIPGHTPGHQGLVVSTEKGTYCIASDAVSLFENWEYQIPPGIHVNLEDCYHSFRKIESLSDYILPSHDLRVLEKSLYP